MKDNLPTNISKRIFWRYVNKRMKRAFHHYHVFGIINILFNEMIIDLKNDKPIKIFNFGDLQLKKTKPRRYFDVNKQKVEISKSNNVLKFNFSSKIKKHMYKYIDLNRTFKL